MWWRKKKESKEELIKRIVEESLLKPGTTADNLAARLSKEAGIDKEAALSLSRDLIEEFQENSYGKKIEIVKEQLSDIYNLPFSETNSKLVKAEIDKLAKNQIDTEQLFDSLFDIQQLESEDWLTKGEKLKGIGKLEDALNSFDISLKFNPYNRDTLVERGKLLQDLNFHKDAIKDFSKVIEDDRNDFSVIYLRGCSYLRFCDFDNAQADISKAIEMSKVANDRQKQVARDKGFDSVASMYKTSMDLLEMLKDSPDQVITGMREKNGKERGA